MSESEKQMDDEALDSALTLRAAATGVKYEERSLSRAVDNLQPLVELVRDAVRGLPLLGGVTIKDATPAQRFEIVRLRRLLVELKRPLDDAVRQFDEAVKVAYAKTGADTFTVEGGKAIGVTKPQRDYITQAGAMRDALVNLIPEGVVTLDEINRALKPETTYRPDHRVLNSLAKHRGELVAQAIEEHRHKPEVDPNSMRVNWPVE